MNRGTDRRKSRRFEVVGRLRGTGIFEQYGQVRDIGVGGALVDCHSPCPVDATVYVRIRSGAFSTRLEARARHCNKLNSGCLIGLQFLSGGVSPADLDRLLGSGD